MKYSLAACIIGFGIDLILGDPQWFSWHPIRLIGNWISICEKIVRKIFSDSDRGLFLAGIVLAFMVMLFSAGIPLLILLAAYRANTVAGLIIESIMCYFLFATKSLKTESMKVYDALKEGNLEKSRRAVSMIVGRDTDRLDETGVAKAAVETVAENASDGVIAPIFYVMLGGAVLGFLYKSINTMDSMIGYKNDKYMHLGTCAARLDDLVNFLPSRLGALFMILAAFLLPGMDGRAAFRIFKRDRYKSSSPNSGQTESVCAGALGIKILGPAYYFGVLHDKAAIGDERKKVVPETIKEANKLMYASAFLTMIILGLLKAAVIWL